MRKTAVVVSAIVALSALPASGQSVRRVALSATDTIGVTSYGSGEVVAIVPGLLGGGYAFRHVTDALVEAGLRVLVIDPLGTGASSKPERSDYSLEAQAARVLGAMSDVAADSAVLLCHSVGGSICYRAALQDSARVRGIVSLNGGPDERAATNSLRWGLRFVPLVKLIGGKGRIRNQLVSGLRKGTGPDSSWVTTENVQQYARPYDDLDATLRALRGMASAKEPLELAPRLPQLSVPVRLLVGSGATKQQVMSADALAILRRIPNLEIDSVSTAGQYIQEEAPSAVVAAVRALLAR